MFHKYFDRRTAKKRHRIEKETNNSCWCFFSLMFCFPPSKLWNMSAESGEFVCLSPYEIENMTTFLLLLLLLWLVFLCVKLLLNGRTSLHVPDRIVILCIWLAGPNEWRAQVMIHMVPSSRSLSLAYSLSTLLLNLSTSIALNEFHCSIVIVRDF